MTSHALLVGVALTLVLASSAATAGENDAPMRAAAGPDQRIECTSPSGATVHLDGTGSTPATNDTIRLQEWIEGSHTLATGPQANVTLGLGTHTITLRVWNQTNLSADDSVTITIVDTHAPTLTVTPPTTDLGTPNHRLVPVTFAVSVHDTCDAAPGWVLASATSDEPSDGTGDGHTTPDIVGADTGTPDTSMQLRAERAGGGDGRAYTITYHATDASGNAVDQAATILVAHGA